jgi:hypothetical protein
MSHSVHLLLSDDHEYQHQSPTAVYISRFVLSRYMCLLHAGLQYFSALKFILSTVQIQLCFQNTEHNMFQNHVVLVVTVVTKAWKQAYGQTRLVLVPQWHLYASIH